ncbi:MAG TPA: stage II sporulation protein R [Tissierellaceae bacterium]
MKYKKLILLLSLFILIFIYVIHPYMEDTKLSFKNLRDKIIRFHIRANSDNEEDQELKLKVRDEILKEMKGKFQDIKDIDEIRKIIRDNMEEMKRIAERIIKREGKDYEVTVTLAEDSFPTRKYGNLVLPAGTYEALLITIGEGKGKNWWCVMFPPLCFVDITHSVAYNLEKELGIELKEDEEPPLKLKWKILEIIKKYLKPNHLSSIQVMDIRETFLCNV